MFDIEKCHKQVFELVAVAEIMKRLKISENEAVKKLDSLYNDINIFSDECLVQNGYSLRHGIMNRINKM
jgi:hypothetical protein